MEGKSFEELIADNERLQAEVDRLLKALDEYENKLDQMVEAMR